MELSLFPEIAISVAPTMTDFMRIAIDALLWGLLCGLFVRLIRRGSSD